MPNKFIFIPPVSNNGGGGGSGDMTKAVYDTNDDGVVDGADTAAALTGTQATAITNNTSHRTAVDAINGIVKGDGAGNYSAVTDNSTNWDTAYGYVNQAVKTSSSPQFAYVTLNNAPTNGSHATTKDYVDNIANGLKWKESVVCATTANIDTSTDLENGDTIDGVTLSTGDRVLVKDQTDAKENGIYVAVASGAASRSSDADSGTELVNSTVKVSQGTANADTIWTCNDNSITIGVNDINFVTMGSIITHNNLSGLQGGTTSEYYHLTSAQHTIATQSATAARDGYLVQADWSTFNGKQDALTFGIANTNALRIDQADAADDEYCRLTANGVESRSVTEVKTDLSLNNVENTALSTWAGSANITTLGTVTTATLSTGTILGGVTMTLGSDADFDLYTRSSNVLTRIAPNTTATQKFLAMTGTGAAGQLPTWEEVSAGAVGGSYGMNVETLSGTKTLTADTSEMLQILNTGGSNRAVNMVHTSAVAGDRFFIQSSDGDNSNNILDIQNNGSSIDEMSPGHGKWYSFNGSNWTAMDYYGYKNTALGTDSWARDDGTALGYNATSDNGSVAVGYGASATGTGGCGVGYNANANASHSTALGDSSTATGNFATALGADTDTRSNSYALAKGYQSNTERYAEEWRSTDGAEPNKYGYGDAAWQGATTDGNATELFLYGDSSNRYDLIANSAIAFRIHAIAYNNTDDVGRSWRIEGAIKRDGSNNTALIGSVVSTDIAEDGSYDTTYDTANWVISITADDTNEALIATVTGEATKTIRWHLKLETSECRF